MDDYQKIVNSLKRRFKKGATAADVCADTALPLAKTCELLPKAADEYSGHLRVTSSGEILYYFPNGFASRYHGLRVRVSEAFRVFKKALGTFLAFAFKAWIMFTLIGYFTLFLALALAAVVFSVVVQSKSSGRSGRRVFFGPNLFSLIWRIWFVQEINRPRYGNYRGGSVKIKKPPLYKAIFSFVFGGEDPNKNWDEKESKAVLDYLLANSGVISLAEFMVLSGKNSALAQEDILSFCLRYEGSPEVTDEGTIVYRFDGLTRRLNAKNQAELSFPVKRLKKFSDNEKKTNVLFVMINAVNFLFGSYFLFNSLKTGLLVSEIQYKSASYLYGFTHSILEYLTLNPPLVMSVALGVTPLVFSLFFWIIPAARRFFLKKENAAIKLINFKKSIFGKIWSNPENICFKNILPQDKESYPENIALAEDRVIKEFGAVSKVEIEQNAAGEMIYSFIELEKEKLALEKYRKSVDPALSKLGDIVFDTMTDAGCMTDAGLEPTAFSSGG